MSLTFGLPPAVIRMKARAAHQRAIAFRLWAEQAKRENDEAIREMQRKAHEQLVEDLTKNRPGSCTYVPETYLARPERYHATSR